MGAKAMNGGPHGACLLPNHGEFEFDGFVLLRHQFSEPSLWSQQILDQLSGEPNERIAVQTNQSLGQIFGYRHRHEVFSRMNVIDQRNLHDICGLVRAWEHTAVKSRRHTHTRILPHDDISVAIDLVHCTLGA